jgi:hypothetical protein
MNNLFGLRPDGPTSGCAQQPSWALEEPDGVAGGGRVQQDHIWRVRLASGGSPFHLFEFAQDKHVRHTGHGRSHHIEGAAADQAPGQAPHPV